MKFYDAENKRLIIFGQKATSEYWDEHWQGQTVDFIRGVKSGKNNLFLKKFTRKFLTPNSKILEGGCGIGKNVYGLKIWGYDAYGVDFAEKTVKKIKDDFPQLKIFVQDVRKLNFPDNFFDGYWSLGVIEHFWKGYNEILEEAKRVIKPGGYLFLAFPYMSPLRKLKARLGFYKTGKADLMKIDNFYQFILNRERTKTNIEKYGFELVSRCSYDATKGLKDEVFWLKPILQKIYDSQMIIAKGIRYISSILFSKAVGHMILLVFRKL